MKTKKISKKLNFKKVTVSNLNSKELSTAKGGWITGFTECDTNMVLTGCCGMSAAENCPPTKVEPSCIAACIEPTYVSCTCPIIMCIV